MTGGKLTGPSARDYFRTVRRLPKRLPSFVRNKFLRMPGNVPQVTLKPAARRPALAAASTAVASPGRPADDLDINSCHLRSIF
jgi:hypothetical protein